MNLSWGGTAVVGTNSVNNPSTFPIPANTQSVTVAAALTDTAIGAVGNAGRTITLTVTAGAGYTVGSPATATATPQLTIRVAIGCFAAPPPSFTG